MCHNFQALIFLVYVPKKTEYPLHIQQTSKSNESTDTFLVAQWGGIMIYNAPETAWWKQHESQKLNNFTG